MRLYLYAGNQLSQESQRAFALFVRFMLHLNIFFSKSVALCSCWCYVLKQAQHVSPIRLQIMRQTRCSLGYEGWWCRLVWAGGEWVESCSRVRHHARKASGLQTRSLIIHHSCTAGICTRYAYKLYVPSGALVAAIEISLPAGGEVSSKDGVASGLHPQTTHALAPPTIIHLVVLHSGR